MSQCLQKTANENTLWEYGFHHRSLAAAVDEQSQSQNNNEEYNVERPMEKSVWDRWSLLQSLSLPVAFQMGQHIDWCHHHITGAFEDAVGLLMQSIHPMLSTSRL